MFHGEFNSIEVTEVNLNFYRTYPAHTQLKLDNMKQILLMLLFVFAGFSVVAQTRTITGKITDGDSGEELPGVTISIKGTSTGTTTGLDGTYSISAADDQTLVISYIGFKTQELVVGSRTVIDVSMDADVEELAEVVIVGYGETTIKDATGAVAAISSEDFNKGVISSPEQLIQGKTAGVQIAGNSGAPGSSVDIRIRGANSVRSNNNPLFVVDGVPLDGGNTTGSGTNVGFGTGGTRNPLNFINPSDIESISILKDASASAIYGSRGSNGVIIITTKSGRGGDLSIDFSSSISISESPREYDLLDRSEFLAAIEDFTTTDPATVDFGNDIDWQDQVLRTSISHKQNISISKGFETGGIRASLGYEDQEGIVEQSGLERITARINGNKSFLDDRLNFTTQVTGSKINDQFAPISGSAGFRGDLLGAAYAANPTWTPQAVYDDIATQIGGGQLHPLNLLESHDASAETDRLLLNTSLSYDLTGEISVKVTYGLDKSSSESFSFLNSDIVNADRGAAGNGRGSYSELIKTSDLFEFTLNYSKSFSNSKLDAVAGYSFQDFGSRGLNSEGWGFNSSDFGTMEQDLVNAVNSLQSTARAEIANGYIQQVGISNNLTGSDVINSGAFANVLIFDGEGSSNPGVPFTTPGGINVSSVFVDNFDNTDKLQSFFGRFNYSLQEKYLFTLTARVDGSSKFGEDNRYGFFPSGAFAWQIGEEDFIGNSISTLKLRVNAGVTGNQEGIGFGQALQRERFGRGNIGDNPIGDDGTIFIPGITQLSDPNKELKWESTLQLGAGLDFGFNSEKLSGSVDYYYKNTSDLLLRFPTSQPATSDFVFRNFDAQVINRGVELTLNYDFIRTSDILFTASFNIAYNENEIQDLRGSLDAGTIRGQGLTGTFAQRLATDQPLFAYYMDVFSGFDSTGEPIITDILDRNFIGEDALPDVTSGLSLNLNYKKWSLSSYLTGQFGFSVYNNTANAFFTAGALSSSRNVSQEVIGNGESIGASAPVSTRFLEKGDFVRLQTLSIGYEVPLSADFIKRLTVSLSGQNLFLITDYSGLDPEVSSQSQGTDVLNGLPSRGIDYTSYPRARIYTLGINASF